MGKIHLTVGVYNDDSYKTNGVSDEHLESHIDYNLRSRPGRALFVDGECLNEGYLSKERCDEWAKKIKSWPVPTRCTAPYH